MQESKYESKYEIKVYKIWWEDEPEEFYIGSTKEKRLSNRMTKHRRDSKSSLKTSKIYQTMRMKGREFKYVQLGSYLVSNRDEQLMFEQLWMDQMKPTLNMMRAHVFAS